jgi:hypothetical protein
MPAQVINLADELSLRALLLSVQDELWKWLQPSGGPGDATTLAILRACFADEGRRLTQGPTRLARAARQIAETLDRDAYTPREIIDAVWQETDIDAPWLCRALKSPKRFSFSYGEADQDG